MLYITSPVLICLITGGLYLLTMLIKFPQPNPQFSDLLKLILFSLLFVSVLFFFFLASEVSILSANYWVEIFLNILRQKNLCFWQWALYVFGHISDTEVRQCAILSLSSFPDAIESKVNRKWDLGSTESLFFFFLSVHTALIRHKAF